MNKIIITLSFLLLSTFAYSQEKKPELTENQKAELRKNHNNSLNFSTKSKSNNGNVSFTSSEEESDKNVKETTTVKYYYGKEDSLFKEFKYEK